MAFVEGDGKTNNLVGAVDADTILGKGGNDRPLGETGDDQLFGGTGNDRLFGGPDGDSLDGGWGNDDLFGDAGGDELFGGPGNDVVHGGAGADSLDGRPGDDEMCGYNGKDIVGGADGHDELHGGKGGDRLFGGRGDDKMTGGPGADRFIFDGAIEPLPAEQDTIVDFRDDVDRLTFFGEQLGYDSVDDVLADASSVGGNVDDANKLANDLDVIVYGPWEQAMAIPVRRGAAFAPVFANENSVKPTTGCDRPEMSRAAGDSSPKVPSCLRTAQTRLNLWEDARCVPPKLRDHRHPRGGRRKGRKVSRIETWTVTPFGRSRPLNQVSFRGTVRSQHRQGAS